MGWTKRTWQRKLRYLFICMGLSLVVTCIYNIHLIAPHIPILIFVLIGVGVLVAVLCSYFQGKHQSSNFDRWPKHDADIGLEYPKVSGDTYDWQRFIDVYIAATRSHLDRDIEEYYRDLLGHLEECFGIRVYDWPSLHSEKPSFQHLMQSTIRSYHAITSPTSGYLEAGLLWMRLREQGEQGTEVIDWLQDIGKLCVDSGEIHKKLIRRLFVLTYGEPERVVTIQELRANGFHHKKEPDYRDYWDNL